MSDSTEPSGSYVYAPLPSEEHFRLVQLRLNQSEDLTCNLSVHRLGESPKYYSLSYYWGESRDLLPLPCNGQQLQVTPALRDALVRLEAIRLDDGVQHFWIDQISINQADLDEQASQVGLMRRIYGQALQTLIWLGPAEDDEAIGAFEVVEALYRYWTNSGKPKLGPKSALAVESPDALDAHGSQFGVPACHSPRWRGLARLLGRPWFKRVWVIQEVAVSPRSPTMLYGRSQFDWTRFAWALWWYTFNGYPTYVKLPVRATVDLSRAVRVYWDSETSQPRPWLLHGLLWASTNLQASRLHDHVYGFLGLTPTASIARDPTEPALDYRQDPFELFGSVTRRCIRESGSLEILSSGGTKSIESLRRQPERPAVPSWIPRWHLEIRDDISHFIEYGKRYWLQLRSDGSVQATTIGWQATKDFPVQMEELDDRLKLKLKGLLMDRIVWCSALCAEDEKGKSALGTIVISIWEAALEYVGQSVNPKDPHNLQLLSLANDFHSILQDAFHSTESIAPVEDFWWFIHAIYANMNGKSLVNSATLAMYKDLSKDSVRYEPLYAFGGQKVFLTRQGRLGFGSGWLEAGDTIWVLFGGMVPFILRRRNDCYLHVGEAFLDHWMYGEAITRWKEGALTAEWVSLV